MELNTPETIRYQTILDLLKTPMKRPLLDPDVPMGPQRPGHDYAVGYPRFTKDYCEHQETPELRWGITESMLQLDRLVPREVASESEGNMISDLKSVKDIARMELVEPMTVAFEELGTAFAIESDMKMRPRRDNREVFSDGLMSGPQGDLVFS